MAYIWLDLIPPSFLGDVKTTVRQINEAVDLIGLYRVNCYALADGGDRDRSLLPVLDL